MLTASASVEDRVDGLDKGADDYLPKPFALAELAARIRALLRRAESALPPVLVHGDLTKRLELTSKELAVLELLLIAQGRVVPAEELLERVWDEMADPFSTVVKVTVRRLRRKLGDPPVVQTVDHGYRV